LYYPRGCVHGDDGTLYFVEPGYRYIGTVKDGIASTVSKSGTIGNPYAITIDGRVLYIAV
jgi:hypothetical protein